MVSSICLTSKCFKYDLQFSIVLLPQNLERLRARVHPETALRKHASPPCPCLCISVYIQNASYNLPRPHSGWKSEKKCYADSNICYSPARGQVENTKKKKMHLPCRKAICREASGSIANSDYPTCTFSMLCEVV